MDKQNPPRAYGVFKPTGYTVIAFPNLDSADAAFHALTGLDFGGEDLPLRYTPAEMASQVAVDLNAAMPAAAVGQELNLVRAHGELAAAGCHFIVVKSGNARQQERVQSVIDAHGAVAAQRYGPFIVYELVEPPTGETQSFESPDRGLDLPAAPSASPERR